MSRNLWGEFTNDEEVDAAPVVISLGAKKFKLEEAKSKAPKNSDSLVAVKVKNPIVTQTIEVMKQTEMLQSLIETYANKSGSSNYLLNPRQMIPQVDFPLENAADLVTDDKFAKPFWFIRPNKTRFTQGMPKRYPYINADACTASIRKTICGQLRVAGFTDIAECALILFSDATTEFLRNFMEYINVILEFKGKDTHTIADIITLEKAYYSLTNSSLVDVHNYFKHDLIARNRAEIGDFNGVLNEYDKLMKESQNLQKEEYQENDFFNILGMSSNLIDNSVGISTHMSEVDSSRNTVLAILEGQGHMSAQNTGYNIFEYL